VDSLNSETLADPVALTRALVDIESVSGDERRITDTVERALRSAPHLAVQRDGNVLCARTELGRERRVVLAGHLDTVPIADNLPARVDGEVLWGCGTSDMKSGDALALHLAVTLAAPRHDVTYLFYDCEEVEAERNGLNRIARTRPDWLAADFAILLEGTYGEIEAGCQGTMRARLTTTGVRAHSARSWLGSNAIHAAGEALDRLRAYSPRTVVIDGCEYREGLNAVRIAGGVAGNIVPDECAIDVNFRFAPDRTEADAHAHVREVFAGLPVHIEITDSAPGALPGLSEPAAAEFLAAIGTEPRGKFGWTDVARFAALGIPALNYGPGDPNVAHARDERVEIPRIRAGAEALRRWLS
jgi:succinyl-diaminopimelate desuccinylase